MGLIEFGTITVVFMVSLFAVEAPWQLKLLHRAWIVGALWAFGLRLSHVTGFVYNATEILLSVV